MILEALQQPIRAHLQHDFCTSVDAVQYDTYREFHFIIDDYEIPEDVTDLRIYIQKPSGNALYNFGQLINGEIVYQPTPQTLAEVGESNGQVQIIKNNAVLTSFPFKINVQKNLVDDDNFTSGKEFLIYDELIKSMQQHDKEIQKTNELVKKQESVRVKSENARVSAENDRIEKETIRVSSENDRISAENTRIENETNRVTAEEERANAETNRQTAETKRQSNETTRKNNESARKAAETKRENDFNKAISEYNDAKTAVDDAIKSINKKLDSTIDDDQISPISTYSSTKIVTLFENQFISSESEPTTQIVGNIWLQEDIEGSSNSTDETTSEKTNESETDI